MTLRVIAVKNARVSGDLQHIYARVLHQILMILKPYSQNRMQKKQSETNYRDEESTPLQLEKNPVKEYVELATTKEEW